ncbi:DUF6456 domain-containing protein [Polymorphobacter sp.]|uniref:DUF6456 domain-containing protein n=1 Tax=Polymorphobacter sp. TaxID=1909290 RepID=UPI003F707780
MKARIQARTSDDVMPEARNRLLASRLLTPSEAIDRRRVTVNLAESPLAWLVRRDMVSRAQFEAGERLRHDFMLAGQAPRITMRWDPAPVSRSGPGGMDPTTAQISARQRFDAAVTAAGPGLADVLWRVICLGDGLETAERALGWPSRAGKLVLKLALDRLVTHYGIR